MLHHQIGTAETMSEQLAHLVEFSGKIVIQIVSGDLGASAGLGSAINLGQ